MEGLKMVHINRYQAGKAASKEKAVNFSYDVSEMVLSYEELAEIQDHFERLARRYGLLTEFRENCII